MDNVFFPVGALNLDWIDEAVKAFEYAARDERSCYNKNFPPMDAHLNKETGTMVMEFALAGYAPEEISVEFTGDRLKVAGKRTAADEKDEGQLLRKGIKTGSFTASYLLPEGKFKTDDAKASFKNGLLVLVIPPIQDWTPRKLVIES